MKANDRNAAIKPPLLIGDSTLNYIAKLDTTRRGHQRDDVMIADFLAWCPPSGQIIIIFFYLLDIIIPVLSLAWQAKFHLRDYP